MLHNLPATTTALVGREGDVRDLRQTVLDGHGRLVTLTGAGGSGKTRLGLAVGADLVSSFPDGVWLVSLASVEDPQLVPSAVASVFNLRERPDESLRDVLITYLAQRQLLLLLDNCEHLVDASAELVASLRHSSPRLRILATSREPLHVDGEVAWRVQPLAFPDPGASPPFEQLDQYPAMQLFAARAAAVHGDFAVTSTTAPVVAAICARVAGLPLAIELAAASVRVLGVNEILERLDDAFDLLVGGTRTAPGRQQTMQAALDWSYRLLTPPAQVVFRRLAVFAGGCSLEAAEAVCCDGEIAGRHVLGLLTRLVDTSLVQVDTLDGRARYRLLEPVRQYAQQRLLTSGEAPAVAGRHASYFLELAEQAETELHGPRQTTWLNRLARDHDNLRAASRCASEAGETERLLRVGAALFIFWMAKGFLSEGRRWLDPLLAENQTVGTPGTRLRAGSRDLADGAPGRSGTRSCAGRSGRRGGRRAESGVGAGRARNRSRLSGRVRRCRGPVSASPCRLGAGGRPMGRRLRAAEPWRHVPHPR